MLQANIKKYLKHENYLSIELLSLLTCVRFFHVCSDNSAPWSWAAFWHGALSCVCSLLLSCARSLLARLDFGPSKCERSERVISKLSNSYSCDSTFVSRSVWEESSERWICTATRTHQLYKLRFLVSIWSEWDSWHRQTSERWAS